MANPVFQNDRYYHIYNRGVDKREIFLGHRYYKRFLKTLLAVNRGEPIGSLFRYSLAVEESDSSKESDSLVDVVAYCLLPNHYHLVVRQKADNGISKLMHKVGVGYTNYFNYHNERSGALFQGKFRAVEITSDDQLWYECAYVLGNEQIHGINNDFTGRNWSNWQDFQAEVPKGEHQDVLNGFKSKADFKAYIQEVISNSRSIKEARKVEEFT